MKYKIKLFRNKSTDVWMETDKSGLDVLVAAKEKNQCTQVIVVTSYETPKVGVEAMSEGAFDYLERNDPAIKFLEVLPQKIELALKEMKANS